MEVKFDRTLNELEELVSITSEYASEKNWDMAICCLMDLIEYASRLITKFETIQDGK